MAGKRAKAKKPAKPASGPGQWMILRIAARILLAVGFIVLVIAAISYLGGAAGERVAQNERYAVRVAEIQCDAPPGADKATFLTEVRYLADLPETVQLVDPELTAKLTRAFTRHPWVLTVNRVHADPGGTIRVDLTFRTPMLAVTVIGEKELRVVDKSGVLLPPGTSHLNLPWLVTPQFAPKTPAGEVWGDPAVRRAAELAETYKPKRLEKTDKGWRLTRDNGPPLIVGW